MKKILIYFLLAASYCPAEQRHLWQEEGKILWCKTICIENSVLVIDAKLEELKMAIENDDMEKIKECLEMIQSLTTNCKNTLGLIQG